MVVLFREKVPKIKMLDNEYSLANWFGEITYLSMSSSDANEEVHEDCRDCVSVLKFGGMRKFTVSKSTIESKFN